MLTKGKFRIATGRELELEDVRLEQDRICGGCDFRVSIHGHMLAGLLSVDDVPGILDAVLYNEPRRVAPAIAPARPIEAVNRVQFPGGCIDLTGFQVTAILKEFGGAGGDRLPCGHSPLGVMVEDGKDGIKKFCGTCGYAVAPSVREELDRERDARKAAEQRALNAKKREDAWRAEADARGKERDAAEQKVRHLEGEFRARGAASGLTVGWSCPNCQQKQEVRVEDGRTWVKICAPPKQTDFAIVAAVDAPTCADCGSPDEVSYFGALRPEPLCLACAKLRHGPRWRRALRKVGRVAVAPLRAARRLFRGRASGAAIALLLGAASAFAGRAAGDAIGAALWPKEPPVYAAPCAPLDQQDVFHVEPVRWGWDPERGALPTDKDGVPLRFTDWRSRFVLEPATESAR